MVAFTSFMYKLIGEHLNLVFGVEVGRNSLKNYFRRESLHG